MRCISPLSILTPDTKERVNVPCGKCEMCLTRLRNAWSFRLQQELKISKSAIFITLTYDDEFNKGNVSKYDIQTWLKRLRKRLIDNEKKDLYDDGMFVPEKEKVSEILLYRPKIRYYITAEYGPLTHRPHYHGIIFNMSEEQEKEIQDTWKWGFIKVGTVTPASINYVTKYCITKNDEYDNREKPFSLMSSKPGLGNTYIDSSMAYHKSTKNFYATLPGGAKISLPKYYREKIFSKEDRKINAKNVTKNEDVSYKEKFRNICKLGNNPFIYEMENIEQIREQIKKRVTKNSKL